MINLGKKTKIEYDPNELYVGSIQRVIRWEHLGHRHDEDYETVQDFAIFYRDENFNMHHVLGTKLTHLLVSRPGDLVDNVLEPFNKFFKKKELKKFINRKGNIPLKTLEKLESIFTEDLTL